MPVADLADALEVAGRGREAAARVLHRLQEDGGDGVRALEEDLLLDLVGGPAAERLRVVTEERRAVDVGVRDLVGAGDQRLERGLEGRQAGDGQGALRRAVVGHSAGYDLVLGGLAGELEVLLGQLPRGLDGLTAAGGEEDLVQVARRVVRQPLGELHGLGVRVRPNGEEGQFLGLLERGLGEFGAAVPGLDDEQAGQPVDVALALVVVDVGALAAHDRRHGGVLVRRHAGEVHPQVVVGRLREVSGHGYLVPQV